MMKFLLLLALASTLLPLSAAVNVVNSNFEAEKGGWRIPDGFSIEPLAGRNSSRGLYVKRTQLNEATGWATQYLRLEPGKSYRVSCYAKANITKKGKYKVGASFVLIFRNGKKVLTRIYNNGLIASSDGKWVRLEREFTTPPEMTNCEMQIGLYAGFLGEAWFDDVNVELNDAHFVYTVSPGSRLLFLDDPTMQIAAVRTGKTMEPGTQARVVIKGADFTAQARSIVKNGRAQLTFKGLKKGSAQAELSLLSRDGQKVLAQENFPVNICETARGRRGAYTDKYGRLIVNGQPFMPLGFYIGQMNKDEIDMISQAGFNTLLSYGSMYLRFNYGKPNNPAALAKTLEVMDYCHRRNIKLVFSVSNVWEQGAYAIRNWYGTKGSDNVIRAAVKAFGDHPALLAWYISDEPPANMRGKLTARRDLLNTLDPYHPTFLVSMHFNELYNFAGSSDIGGVDPYPIMNRAQDMYDVRHAGQQSAKLNKPFWGVMQCFNQAYYTKTTPENHHKMWTAIHRDPSAEEMRSMCFQLAQFGAKGFLFYYWNCIRDYDNRSKDPEYFNKCFARMKEVAAAMKNLQPYLLSTYPAETVKLQRQSGRVTATMHRAENGKKCILITAEGPGDASAEFKLDGQYQSLFGRTAASSGGYCFRGKNISSDMLIEK